MEKNMDTLNIDDKGQIFNERSLYLINIRQLRVLGRQLGVPSPTTKNKKELIDYILNIIYGKIEAPIRNSFGRNPATNEFDFEKFLKITKQNNNIDDYIYPKNIDTVYLQKVASPESEYKLDESVELKTYHFENGKHFLKKMAFISSKSDIELTKEFVKKYNLKDLDVVEINSIDKLVNVISINGKKCGDNFKQLKIFDYQLSSGVKKEFFTNDSVKLKQEIEKLLPQTDGSDLEVVVFSENDYKNKKLQTEVFSKIDDSTIVYKKLMNFLNLCENNIVNGEKILVIIENYNYVKKMVSLLENDIANRMNQYLNDIFNEITKLGNVVLLLSVDDDYVY